MEPGGTPQHQHQVEIILRSLCMVIWEQEMERDHYCYSKAASLRYHLLPGVSSMYSYSSPMQSQRKSSVAVRTRYDVLIKIRK